MLYHLCRPMDLEFRDTSVREGAHLVERTKHIVGDRFRLPFFILLITQTGDANEYAEWNLKKIRLLFSV